MEIIGIIFLIVVAAIGAIVIKLLVKISEYFSAKTEVIGNKYAHQILRSFSFWLVFIFSMLLYTWKVFEEIWYERFVPDEVGIVDVLDIEAYAGLMEGRGIVVFDIDQDNADQINMNNLSYLSRMGRSPNGRLYSDWKETPVHIHASSANDRWMRAMYLDDLDEDIGNSIKKALSERGGYYSASRERAIFVFPKINISIFVYCD